MVKKKKNKPNVPVKGKVKGKPIKRAAKRPAPKSASKIQPDIAGLAKASSKKASNRMDLLGAVNEPTIDERILVLLKSTGQPMTADQIATGLGEDIVVVKATLEDLVTRKCVGEVIPDRYRYIKGL